MNTNLNQIIEATIREIEELELNMKAEHYKSLSQYDIGYLNGEHDRAICLLDQLHVSHNFQFSDYSFKE